MGISKFFKDISGINAYKNRKQANAIKESSLEKYEFSKAKLEEAREHLNRKVQSFGQFRCSSLQATVGRFLSYLKRLDINFSNKEYEIPSEFNISGLNISEMESINMNAKEIMATTVTSGIIASAALTGVPAAVTGAVGALATASTGTAIASLSGAAETNAILAWLGGGSLASGGGGMALGATVLTGVTWAASGAVALLSAGFIASKYFEQKLTQAKQYEAEVSKACAQVDLACTFIKNIEQRIDELKDVTTQLCNRSSLLFERMEPILSDFYPTHPYHIKLFQELALLMKSISELSKTPVLDAKGNLSETGQEVIYKTRKLLNTEL